MRKLLTKQKFSHTENTESTELLLHRKNLNTRTHDNEHLKMRKTRKATPTIPLPLGGEWEGLLPLGEDLGEAPDTNRL